MQALLPTDFFRSPNVFGSKKKIFDEQVCYLYYVSKKCFYVRFLEKDFNFNKTLTTTLNQIQESMYAKIVSK